MPTGVSPTARVYTPGVIPETTFEAQNGATSFVRFGNTPIKSKLQLVYQNISESEAFQFAETYNRCIITDQGIRIDPGSDAIKDVNPMLMGELVRGANDGLTWKFEQPPAIEPFGWSLQCHYRPSRHSDRVAMSRLYTGWRHFLRLGARQLFRIQKR